MEIPVILAFASACLAGAVAFAIAWYERRSGAHWYFVAGMATLALESLFSGLAADAALPQDVAYWQNFSFLAMSFLPGTWLLFSLIYARGNWVESLTKWRFVLIGAVGLPVGLALWFRKSLVSVVYPEEGAWTLGLGTFGLVVNLIFLLSMILVLMNLERTFRAAVGTMRWRIKFIVLGLALLFAVRTYTSSQVLLFRAVNLALLPVNSVALLAACLLTLRSLFRAGHFEVRVYPSQSVLRNSLTVMLAGAYLVTVGLLAKVVTWLGGDAGFTLKAFVILVSLVLLAMVFLSDRVRLHSRRFVSRHFQRPLYDYRSVWRTFTEETARCVEKKDLCQTVPKLVSQLFECLSVTVWLVNEKRDNLVFAGSTSLTEASAAPLRMDPANAAPVLAALGSHPDPIDLDSSRETWVPLLRRLHPSEFQKGGNRSCVPMISGGELLGVMMLGDRVGGVPFGSQDLDLLRSVSDQAAAGLLNIQLAERLSQAKQLEAFQSMSAFFVHDLKNTASTLSLMLQNLPVHFHDPSFRADALRGISKTVNHINELINRLSLLRHGLTIEPVETDLNELVTQALGCLEQTPSIKFLRQLEPLPKVRIDPARIQTVVTNILLNARDAVGASGLIRVEMSQRNGWVTLVVTDNGCGMSAQFIEHLLFRPFQTTKKNGIGIGMFQCKMIVEAHRGRIEVESERGKGTTFRVLLPIGVEE